MRDMKLSSISSKNVFQTKIEKTVEKKKKSQAIGAIKNCQYLLLKRKLTNHEINMSFIP